MTPATAFPLYLMLQLASGEMLPAQELPAAQCLTLQAEIQTSAKADVVSYAGKREMIVWATCWPWPPLDCTCGGADGEAETQ